MKWKRTAVVSAILLLIGIIWIGYLSTVGKSQEEITPGRINHLKPFNLLYCHISKNMNMKMNSLIVRARNQLAASPLQRKDIRPEWERYLLLPNTSVPYGRIGPSDAVWTNQTVTKMAIIREPLDRFISAYLMYCHNSPPPHDCNSSRFSYCGRNPICILNLVNNVTKQKLWHRQSFQLTHFAPQKFQCYFRQHLHDYQLLTYEHSENFNDALMSLLSRHFPKKFLESGWDSSGGAFMNETTSHSTFKRFSQIRNRLRTNNTVIKAVVNAYRMDYDMFGFAKPEEDESNYNSNGPADTSY